MLSPDGDVSSFGLSLHETLANISKDYNTIHLTGDFNVPKLRGCFNVFNSVPVPEQDFMDTINSFNLFQLNTHHPRDKCDNILDLIFSSTPDQGGVSLRCSYEPLVGTQLAKSSQRTDRSHLQFVNLFH